VRRRRLQRKQKRRKIMMRRKKRKRRRKRRNKLIFQSKPRLKSNPCNFTHSKIESLLLYQRLDDFARRAISVSFCTKL